MAPLAFKSTLSIVITGLSQAGKNEQIKRIFNARLPDGTYPFRPLYIVTSEESGKGTMGDVLTHPDCTHVSITTLEEFTNAIGPTFDAGHRPTYDPQGNLTGYGTPFRVLCFDGWTAFTEAAKMDAQALAVEEDGSKTLNGKAKQNDPRIAAKVGASEARVALREWSGVGAKHPGLLMLSTAHASEKWAPIPGAKQGERYQCGEQLDLAYQPAKWLYNGANLLIMLARALVEAESLDALEDATAEDVAPNYFALTRPVSIAGYTYSNLIKWQDGIFASTPETKRVKWNNPDLGAALLESPLLLATQKPTPKTASPKVPQSAT